MTNHRVFNWFVDQGATEEGPAAFAILHPTRGTSLMNLRCHLKTKPNKLLQAIGALACIYLNIINVAQANTNTAPNQAMPCPTGSAFGLCVQKKTTELADFGPAKSLREIAGGDLQVFRPPNRWHDAGVMHAQMYRVMIDGEQRLIKTLSPQTPQSLEKQIFLWNLFGMMLSAEIGGPSITRAGQFLNPDGTIGFYIEMKELFADDKTTFTWKGLQDGRNRFLRLFTKKQPQSSHLAKIAQMLRFALERNIFLRDLDLLFSSDEVYWLDSAQWSVANWRSLEFNDDDVAIKSRVIPTLNSPNSPLNKVIKPAENDILNRDDLLNYYGLIDEFYRFNPEMGKTLLGLLKREIERSEVFNPEQKNLLWTSIRSGLVELLAWSPATFEAAELRARAKPQGQTLNSPRQSCVDLFVI
jgi:hypothetical protein